MVSPKAEAKLDSLPYAIFFVRSLIELNAAILITLMK
jgi:hypothetical protein